MRQKPIDRWLALVGIAVGVLCFLLPKTELVIALSVITLFVVLVHPTWNFWWIEKSFARRTTSLLCVAICCAGIGYIVWPKRESSVAVTPPTSGPVVPRPTGRDPKLSGGPVIDPPRHPTQPIPSQAVYEVRLVYDRGRCKVERVTQAGTTLPLSDHTDNFATVSLAAGPQAITVWRAIGPKDVRIAVAAKKGTPQTVAVDCE
jgi:hypothetical protein